MFETVRKVRLLEILNTGSIISTKAYEYDDENENQVNTEQEKSIDL